MGDLALSTLLAALLLAAVHLAAGRLDVLDRVPRSAWLSGAAGYAALLLLT